MIFKYYSNESPYALENFRKDQICFSHVDQFNDSLEFNAIFDESTSLNGTMLSETEKELISCQIEAQKFNIRIFCSSMNEHNDYLWKNYTNNCMGFCLGYDEKEIEKLSNLLIMKKVNYSDDIPALIYKEIKESVIKQIFHKRLKFKDEEEFRIALCLCDKDIEVENNNNGFQLEKNSYSEYVTFTSKFPTNHLTRQNNEPPNFEKKTSLKNIFLNIKPKILIIGNKCPNEIQKDLKVIAQSKNIIVKGQGDKND